METRYSIPGNKIEEVRYASDIHDVVSDYVMLTKKGINHFGLCPFHSEKTPSFSVNTEKQIFHCFGCGVGGGVINFIMKIENLSFPEAVKFLAEKSGIQIQVKPVSKKEQEEAKQVESIYASLKKASDIYQVNLKSAAGKEAREYLEKRGISEETRDKFKLGYAKKSWDDLSSELQRSKISPQIAEKAGILISKKGGGFYDRFRGRIIFPIFNLRGQIIAFGGRILKGEDPNEAKYLNSPETGVYKKRYILYGLNYSGSTIRKEKSIILVEGYFDLISLFACGIENAAATSGTSLTNEHAKLIKRYTDNVYLFFDPDFAGVKATFRGIDLLISHGFSVNIASLPKGEDPDSYAIKNGREGIQNLIKNSKPFMEFYIEKKAEGINLNSPKEQLNCILEVKPILTKIPNQIEKMKYAEMLSSVLKVDRAIIIDELSKGDSKKRKVDLKKTSATSTHSLEEQAVLGLLIKEIEDIDQNIMVRMKPDYFKSENVRNSFNLFMSELEKLGNSSSKISFDEIEESDAKRFLTGTMSMDWSEFNREQTLLDFIEKGEMSLLKKESMDLNIKLAGNLSDDDTEVIKLLREKEKLLKKIHGNNE